MSDSDTTIELTRDDFTVLPDGYGINDPRPRGAKGGRDAPRGRSPYREGEGLNRPGGGRPNLRPERPAHGGQSSRPSQGQGQNKQGSRPFLRPERPAYGGESSRPSHHYSRRHSPSPSHGRSSRPSYGGYSQRRSPSPSHGRSSRPSQRRPPSPSYAEFSRPSYGGYSQRRPLSPSYAESSRPSHGGYSQRRPPSPLYGNSSRRSHDYSRRRSPSPSYRKPSTPSDDCTRRRSPSPNSVSPVRRRFPGEPHEEWLRYLKMKNAQMDKFLEERDARMGLPPLHIETFIDPRFDGFLPEKRFYALQEADERLDRLEKQLQAERLDRLEKQMKAEKLVRLEKQMKEERLETLRKKMEEDKQAEARIRSPSPVYSRPPSPFRVRSDFASDLEHLEYLEKILLRRAIRKGLL